MTSPEQKSALNIVMGAMTFGESGKDGARVHNIKDVEAILDVFRSHGHTEIDTARVYASGTSEQFLGQIDLQSKGLKIETKLYPTLHRAHSTDGITHTPEGLRTHLLKSLEALNVKSLEMWYLHAPDRSVPYEVTFKAVNDLYKEGYFKRFGISNYAAWEVAEIVHICRTNGYIQPTAYQGIYNAVHRSVEPELFPCLRKFGISFYEFNPLGGGFFTGRYTSTDDIPEAGSRFDPERIQGKNYRGRYWKEPYFKAINSIRAVAVKHGLTTAEVALRWVSHHSFLKREYGDSILIGASSLEHIEQNLIDLEKGPLPEEVVQGLDAAWQEVQPFASKYFH
ncbi:Aldo/keto reductase [Macrolepiota fuliginosa MF-IS2]|uniref:Aldo/keto reductase n=1 Tax=Macrolepiota fuliginosa MF-IS2 TaxID=1400762 RepID=A0A9P5XHT7_9AGAR|nr:Aldo/keto reductase [Macrolepiota fuliginosa MF-IS2]